MSEFELHQLMIASRWEFDYSTLVVCGIGFLFAIVALAFQGRLKASHSYLMMAMCLVPSAFFGFRAFAAIVRFVKIKREMGEMTLVFDPSYQALQTPTFYSRMFILVLVPLIAIYLLKTAQSKE